MKVIFKADVKGQGKKGEMKEDSEGYGRNYLLPRGLAVEANKDNLNTLALKEKARKAQEARERAEAEEAAANGYVFIDLHSRFVDADGYLDPRYTNDGLHLTGEGYRLWRELLIPYVRETNTK